MAIISLFSHLIDKINPISNWYFLEVVWWIEIPRLLFEYEAQLVDQRGMGNQLLQID